MYSRDNYCKCCRGSYLILDLLKYIKPTLMNSAYVPPLCTDRQFHINIM